MQRANNLLVVASFIWLVVSFWNRNDLPGNIDYVAGAQSEPRQSSTSKKPFGVAYNGVVWGDNTTTAQLDKLNFWNGIFTCNVETRDQAAWDSFDMDQLSNNHLISADEVIRDRVQDIRIGDQVRIRGHLAGYSSPGVGHTKNRYSPMSSFHSCGFSRINVVINSTHSVLPAIFTSTPRSRRCCSGP